MSYRKNLPRVHQANMEVKMTYKSTPSIIGPKNNNVQMSKQKQPTLCGYGVDGMRCPMSALDGQ